jgi:hypothetical protein
MSAIEQKNSNINHTVRRKILPYIIAAGVTAASIGLAGCTREVQVPGPTKIVVTEIQVPGPTIITTTTATREVQVPGPTTTIIKEGSRPITRRPEVTSTPQPNGTIYENPTDPPPSSFGSGESAYAGPNDIIVGDVVIDGIKMSDDNQYTGLITNNLEANAFVYYPYGGSKITISDPIKRAAEIERQRQIMILSGKRPDVINYFGGPQQPVQR